MNHMEHGRLKGGRGDYLEFHLIMLEMLEDSRYPDTARLDAVNSFESAANGGARFDAPRGSYFDTSISERLRRALERHTKSENRILASRALIALKALGGEAAAGPA